MNIIVWDLLRSTEYVQDLWDGAYGSSSLSQIVTLKAGLKITINRGTMSGQNGNMTAQKLHSPVILTGLAYSHSWTHSQLLTYKS